MSSLSFVQDHSEWKWNISALKNLLCILLTLLAIPILAQSPTKPLPAGKKTLAAAPVLSLAYSPDGKTLAVALYKQVQLWDVATNKLREIWKGHPDTVRSVVYSKDGKLLVACGGVSGASGEVRIWDTVTNHEIRKFGDHIDNVLSVAISPDSTRVVTGGADKLVKVWETATGKLIGTIKEHADAIWGVAYRPDGTFFATTGGDKSIKVWDSKTLKRAYSVTAHDELVNALMFSPDGAHMVSVSNDKSTRYWNFRADNSDLARNNVVNDAPILCTAYSPNSALIACGSADKTVLIFNGNDINLTRTLKDAEDWVYSVAFSPDSKKLAAGTWDGKVLIYSTADWKLEKTLSAQ